MTGDSAWEMYVQPGQRVFGNLYLSACPVEVYTVNFTVNQDMVGQGRAGHEGPSYNIKLSLFLSIGES